jgi:hypothetical protein
VNAFAPNGASALILSPVDENPKYVEIIRLGKGAGADVVSSSSV